MPPDSLTNQDRKDSHEAKYLILKSLYESDSEAEIEELKSSTWDLVKELESDNDEESPLHFVPTVGSDTPRSRSFNRSLRRCQGSEWVKREGNTVLLTDEGEELVRSCSEESSR